MRFYDSVSDYIIGKKFEDSLKVKLYGDDDPSISRKEYLTKICLDKNIIHFGCVDHLELYESKLNENNWLHQSLIDISKKCVGIDINCEGIKFLIKQGYSDVYCLDITKSELPTEIKNQEFDYIILGEILEHVNNPVYFLKKIRDKFSFDKIIITVPNALRMDNFTRTIINTENVNSDHRYWFTPYTLSKILSQSGLNAQEITLLQWHGLKGREKFRHIVRYIFPLLRDTIIIEAKKN